MVLMQSSEEPSSEAAFKLAQTILLQLEAGTHGVAVAGMFFFDDNNFVLRKGDPIGGQIRAAR